MPGPRIIRYRRMIHRAQIFILSLILSLQPTLAQENVEALTARVRESLVVISQVGRDGFDRGVGSGFVISEDGLIATCNHVIGESRELKVRLENGEEFEATAIHAWDRNLDLAVLRIDPGDEKLKPMTLGNSDDLAEGQRIITIGNPHGLSFSVVEGLVSAIREIEEGGPPMIQVAIPVEPGNSGGPLIDLEGNVHGIVSMKSTVTDNLGFATPANALKALLEKPNSVPMKNWVTIGALDPRQWQDSMGARWRQRAGTISVESAGKGFGGRSLCLSSRKVPDLPYEVEVTVRMDDESGAAGLAFESDGGDIHYGFYPSNGQLRLTRFDGPDVYSWKVLHQERSKAYRPEDWNHLRIRLTEKKITAFVNGEQVLALEEDGLRSGGKAGLVKFRQTQAEFRKFKIGRDLTPIAPDPKTLAELSEQLQELEATPARLERLAENPDATRLLLKKRRESLQSELKEIETLSAAVHQKTVTTALLKALDHEEETNIDLFLCALLVSKLDNPDLDVTAYTDELSMLTESAKAAVDEKGEPLQRLKKLSNFLFKENGFHGSRGAYYSRSNSYVNEVIDDREGIPITLAVIYIELAGRIGIEGVHGLGLPGHFVVRHDQQIIDVFDAGKFITIDEAGKLAGLVPALGESADQYEPSSKRQIIQRMLTNLKAISIDAQATEDALRYVNLLVAIDPEDPAERLSRALLSAQADQPEIAIQDLEWIFEREPTGIDMERLKEFHKHLKER